VPVHGCTFHFFFFTYVFKTSKRFDYAKENDNFSIILHILHLTPQNIIDNVLHVSYKWYNTVYVSSDHKGIFRLQSTEFIFH
jgi:hypothetical protein